MVGKPKLADNPGIGAVELTVTGLLVAATLSVFTLSFPRTVEDTERSVAEEMFVGNWQELRDLGFLQLGEREAPKVAAIAFMDLECPACAAFHTSLSAVLERGRFSIEAIYVHYPLSYHPFALPAARVTQCLPEGKARLQFVRAIYVEQQLLSERDLPTWAAEVTGYDLDQIMECLGNPGSLAGIQAGLDAGKEIALDVVPLIILNGRVFRGVVSEESFTSAVEEAMSSAGSQDEGSPTQILPRFP